MDNDDLEDGEIEDGEIEEDDEPIAKTNSEQKDKLPPPSTTPNTIQSRSNVASKNTATRNNQDNPFEDDFASNIQKALAMALKRDGIEPPLPQLPRKPSSPSNETTNTRHQEGRHQDKSERRSSKQKKRSHERSKSKKNISTDLETPFVPMEMEDDQEFLNVRGASPTMVHNINPMQQYDDSYESDNSRSSYESYDSMERRYEGRRPKRERRGRFDRNKKQETKGSYKRSGRDRDRDDSDSEKSRKMELCKFYLMECCAKRDKCLYMHSDFPCKYYYLGLQCNLKEKNQCKFSHGKPLLDTTRAILLKHLETAPKEILGDFPRISRDNAIKMIDATHIKLMIEFGLAKPAPEIPPDTTNNASKIPSLLDINISKPLLSPSKNMDDINRLLKPRKTRWCDSAPTVPSAINLVTPSLLSNPTKSSNYLSLKCLSGVLTVPQIAQFESMGINTLDQINLLTMAQMNELGITIDQIRAIQLNAMNIQKLGLPTTNTSDIAAVGATLGKNTESLSISKLFPDVSSGKDLDMRVPPLPSNTPMDSMGMYGSDVDMRVMPIPTPVVQHLPVEPVQITNPVDMVKITNSPAKINYVNSETKSSGGIDYSKYLKDSNIEYLLSSKNSDSEEELKINIDQEPEASTFDGPNSSNWASLDSTKDSSTLSESSKPFCDPRLAPEKEAEKSTNDVTTGFEFYSRPYTTVPSNTSQHDKLLEESHILSPKGDSDRNITAGYKSRVTIYDSNPDGDDLTAVKKADKDMRKWGSLGLDCDADDKSTNGDLDFNLPFKPLTHYVPATEIDASISSHGPIEFKLVAITIPKPDYSDIRRNFPAPKQSLDPRLRRIFALKDSSTDDETKDVGKPESPLDPYSGAAAALGNTTNISATARIDPRRKKEQEQTSTYALNKQQNPLDIQQILQKSIWYKDLNSTRKMSVNQNLAELSTDMKAFMADTNPDKVFETSPLIYQMLMNLGVHIDDQCQIIEISNMDSTLKPGMSDNLMSMMIGNMPMNFNTQRPNSTPFPNQMMMNFSASQGRPSLLGIAPNMPFNYMFPPQGQRPFYPGGNGNMGAMDRFGDNNKNISDDYDRSDQFPNNFRGGDGGGGGGGRYNNDRDNFGMNFNQNRNNRNNFRGGDHGGNSNRSGGPDRWRHNRANKNRRFD